MDMGNAYYDCRWVINALLADKGFVLPTRGRGVWCPGLLTNIMVGAFSAFASWAFCGSGASIDLAQATARTQIGLRFSALAGALLVGVAGARWITSEVDKQLLKESVKVAATKKIFAEACDAILKETPRRILKAVENTSRHRVSAQCRLALTNQAESASDSQSFIRLNVFANA